ncbi:MAG TPA: hypothetical protein VGM77_06835 [Gemmatimonadales bacterium]|jgi:hypothetical protein
MPTSRHLMTVRVVPLHSPEAGDARVGGTIPERIALVSALSADLWTITGRPLPVYSRAMTPIAVVPRQRQTAAAVHDD